MESKKKLILFFSFTAFALVAYWVVAPTDTSFTKFKHRPSDDLDQSAPAKTSKNNFALSEPETKREPAQTRASSLPDKGLSREKLQTPDKAQKVISKANKFRQMRKAQAAQAKDTPKGDFNVSGDSYSLLENYSAIEVTNYNQNDFPGAIVVNGHFIVNEPPVGGDGLSVVKNLDTGNYAVFRGVIMVKLRDFRYESEVSRAVGGEIFKSYEHLQRVFYRFRGYEETLRAQSQLLAHPQVLSAEIELLEYERQPR